MTSPTDSTITTKIKADWSWITHHLVSLVLVGGLALGGVQVVESLVAKHDAATNSKYQAILTAEKAQTDAMWTQYKTNEAERAQEYAQLIAQNTQLTKTIEQRNTQVAQLVKIDATLSAEQAAAKISTQISAAPGEVTANGNSVDLDLNSARGVVSRLDEFPVAQANLQDTQKQLVNETQIAANAQSNLNDANKVIGAQNTQLAGADKACQAQISQIKSDNRKNTLKKLLFGGIIVEAIRVYLTHSL